MSTLLYSGDMLGGPGTGALGGPPMQHNYKRAVFRAAPQDFAVEVLPATKFGSGYCYGMRIYPLSERERDGVLHDDRSSSAHSTSSGGSMHTAYDVWRRWEDCLYFQDMLESEYALMARTKRARLAAGKGVKKNGIYVRADAAASFESLPPGPDARTIAKDIHEIVPRLTKKGTFFRAGPATIAQRSKEFKDMIEALTADDVPMLIRELREARVVRDFFGYWRRDRDLVRKASDARPASAGSAADLARASTTSAFSMYFSSSTASVPLTMPMSAPPRPRVMSSSSGSTSASSGDAHARGLPFSVSDRGSLALTLSPLADDAGAVDVPPGPRSATSRIPSIRWTRRAQGRDGAHGAEEKEKDEAYAHVEEVPVLLARGLGALPEEREAEAESQLAAALGDVVLAAGPPPRPPETRGGRTANCIVFSPMQEEEEEEEEEEGAGHEYGEEDGSAEEGYALPAVLDTDSAQYSQADSASPVTPGTSRPPSMAPSTLTFSELGEFDRADWRMSSLSADSLVAGFGAPSCAPARNGHGYRASIATMNSLVSGASVDAVLPRRWSPPPVAGAGGSAEPAHRTQPGGARRPPSALSIVPPPPLHALEDEVEYDPQEELLDAYFYDPSMRSASPADSAQSHACDSLGFPRPPSSVPAARQFHLPWSEPGSAPDSPARPGSASTSVTSPTSLSGGHETITIKAMLNDSIVLLRAGLATPLAEVRERLRDKFARQEGVPLPETFVIGYVPQGERARQGSGRARSNSCSTVGTENVNLLRFVSSDEEWQTAVAGCAAKLTIRVFHTRPQ
ncbi:hypothetical protein WOLCODRAFT_137675 [Wolfiporia cocos MD-104 SS10]|uniref:PX domain-containing protein n=1 Tax=Wolfiporia cocos (strain MD-104) TaxID=742152 RepID=A0A2H3JIQ9_WOLCO|nr:hypothetical protein WOLCODRAFT_137675 [Wolfiporia cocos MD-104 SS10]